MPVDLYKRQWKEAWKGNKDTHRPSSNGPMVFAWISVIVVNFISWIALMVDSETPRSPNESKLTDVKCPPDGI